MPIVLYRVDERLIHGQVVVGWGSKLRPDRYAVVDGVLAESQWERELYALSVPEGAEALFLSANAAKKEHRAWRESEIRTLLLTRDIETMLELGRSGLLRDQEVNLGGLHHSRGREQVLPYLFLDESDRRRLEALEEAGAVVSAQDLPGSAKVRLSSLLG